MRPLRVLNIEDSHPDHELIKRHLSSAGFDLTVARVETSDAMESALNEQPWDVILCDYSMPGFSAPSALELLRRLELDIPFIIISGTVGEEEAVRALKAGASDYLIKDNLARLIPAIERERQDAENRRARRRAEEEQKRLDAELFHERGRISDVVAAVPGVVWEMSETASGGHLKVEFVSDYAEKLVGFPVQAWLDTPDFWFTLIHEEDRERVRQAARDALAKGEGWRMEFRWIREDGRSIWVDSRSVAIKNAAGRPTGFRGVCFDISERKRAELILRESEARFRALFESNPQPLWVYDLETLKFLKVNDAAIKHYGYSHDEYMSMTIKDIRPPEDVPGLLERIKKAQRQNAYSTVRRHQKKDGTIIDVEIAAHDLKLASSKSRLVLANDITERLRAESALTKSEQRYRDLVENAHDIIYSHDVEGNFISMNRSGQSITGYTRDEILDTNIFQMVAPEHVDRFSEMIAAHLNGEDTPAYELDLLARDGHRISVEVNTELIAHDGRPQQFHGIARDITARKRLEEQLLQAQKLESVGRLAGGIAHDFNNMLTAINGYSDLTLRRLSPDDPVRKNIEEVRKAGERSAALTNQLLAFSRQQMLRLEIVEPNKVVVETTRMLERVIGEDIELKVSLEPSLGRIKADPGQLSQIVMNLMVNARDAMPAGGTLTIETSNVTVDADFNIANPEVFPGEYVRLSVSDTGTGISDADMAHIFEPFFTTKEVGRGTGLGLSTVYGIVKQSGGSILVESELGAGTTFNLYLPHLRDGEEMAEKVRQRSDLDRGTETILIVEDEELVRSVLKSVLEGCGYTVIDAENGAGALSLCRSMANSPDLLITDLVMPQMGGRELAEKVVEIMPDLPVIFTSGYTEDVSLQEAVKGEKMHFIQKPFTIEAVSTKVREVLDAARAAE